MIFLDGVGHACCALKALGLWQLSRRRRIGWLLRLAGGGGWVAVGLALGLSSLWIWGIAFAVLDTVGFLCWRDGDMKETERDRAACLMDRLIRLGVPRTKLQDAIDWLMEGRSRYTLPRAMRNLREEGTDERK